VALRHAGNDDAQIGIASDADAIQVR